MKWTKGKDGLPGLFDEVEWRNADGGNIPLGRRSPLEHYQKVGANINLHEWLDESPESPSPSLQEAAEAHAKEQHPPYAHQGLVDITKHDFIAGWNAREAQQTGLILTRELHDKIWKAALDWIDPRTRDNNPDRETFFISLNL